MLIKVLKVQSIMESMQTISNVIRSDHFKFENG
jgi:hypothetical protein